MFVCGVYGTGGPPTQGRLHRAKGLRRRGHPQGGLGSFQGVTEPVLMLENIPIFRVIISDAFQGGNLPARDPSRWAHEAALSMKEDGWTGRSHAFGRQGGAAARRHTRVCREHAGGGGLHPLPREQVHGLEVCVAHQYRHACQGHASGRKRPVLVLVPGAWNTAEARARSPNEPDSGRRRQKCAATARSVRSRPPCSACVSCRLGGMCVHGRRRVLRAVMVVFGCRHRTAGEDSGADRSLDRGGEADGPQGGRIAPHAACRTRSRTTLSFGQCRLHQADQPRS